MINIEPLQNIESFPEDWMNSFSDEENFEIFCSKKFDLIKNDQLRDFALNCQKLSQLSRSINTESMKLVRNHGDDLIGINYKKLHEISAILEFIDSISHKPGKIIEIGGGKGNLTQIICKKFGIGAISIDMDDKFQEIGQKRNQKQLTGENLESISHHEMIKFINMKIDQQTNLNVEIENKINNECTLINPYSNEYKIDSSDMSVGLHTCGLLSKHQFDSSIKLKLSKILNIGCCYPKIDVNDEVDLNKVFWSEYARRNIAEHNIKYGRDMLSLANRAHNATNTLVANQNLREKVKRQRQTVQLLLNKMYGSIQKFILKSNKNIQKQSFLNYTKDCFRILKINMNDFNLKDDEIEAFYLDTEIYNQVTKMLKCGIIRSMLGKPTEVYLLLDRAIYLHENGQQVSIKEIFDEQVSPRSIAIQAELKE